LELSPQSLNDIDGGEGEPELPQRCGGVAVSEEHAADLDPSLGVLSSEMSKRFDGSLDVYLRRRASFLQWFISAFRTVGVPQLSNKLSVNFRNTRLHVTPHSKFFRKMIVMAIRTTTEWVM
jgi:hypothetical protein